MRFIFIVLLGFSLFSVVTIILGEGDSKIIGEWGCEQFVIEDEYFKVDGKTEIKFDASNKSTTQVNHYYDFGESHNLYFTLQLYGEWGWDADGFWEMITGSDIFIIENNTQYNDEKISEFAMKYFTLRQKTYSKVEFLSDDKFLWTKENDPNEITCIRKK